MKKTFVFSGRTKSASLLQKTRRKFAWFATDECLELWQRPQGRNLFNIPPTPATGIKKDSPPCVRVGANDAGPPDFALHVPEDARAERAKKKLAGTPTPAK